MVTYTNMELANFYSRMKAIGNSRGIARETVLRTRDAIERCDRDIGEFYEDHGSLRGFRAIGIGDETKKYLARIIELGGEAAVKEAGRRLASKDGFFRLRG